MMSNPRRKRKNAASAISSNLESPNSDIPPSDNPASATIEVTAVEVPELTEAEQRDRLHLERQVEKAFYLAAKALAELRDRRLYRSTHKTFEEYCRSRFGYTHRHVNYLIAASVVVDNIITGTNCSQNEKADETGTNCSQNEKPDQTQTNQSQILPTAEGQVRPLTKLEPQQQQEVWLKAVVKAGGKVPSARIVKDVVQQVMERTQVPNTYQLGEVCQILAKDNPDLKGKGGCWGIVSQVNQFSCTVKMWDGEYTVAVKHLKSYEYLAGECEQMQEVCDRITRVYSSELEESVQKFLESLGKINRAYLTALEEKVLSLLELEIRV